MNLLSMRDLDRRTVERILHTAMEIQTGDLIPDLSGKILSTLFFEPSTRTKMSFQCAALRSKMQYLDFQPENSSLKKGESFSDTIRIVSGYADVLAIRHQKEGAARLAADLVEKPIINCGDGTNQHPSQTLIDLFSMLKFKGKISGLSVTLFGDLKHARVMHSLLYGLAMFGARVTLTAPKGLEIDPPYLDELRRKFDFRLRITDDPDFSSTDVLYICRVHQERFSDPLEAKNIAEKFVIKESDLRNAHEELVLLHALPRMNEITPGVDKLAQAKYFQQAHFGVPVRQAILDYVLK